MLLVLALHCGTLLVILYRSTLKLHLLHYCGRKRLVPLLLLRLSWIVNASLHSLLQTLCVVRMRICPQYFLNALPSEIISSQLLLRWRVIAHQILLLLMMLSMLGWVFFSWCLESLDCEFRMSKSDVAGAWLYSDVLHRLHHRGIFRRLVGLFLAWWGCPWCHDLVVSSGESFALL
jgi:hypothetical protein